jgi:hypothetical protein
MKRLLVIVVMMGCCLLPATPVRAQDPITAAIKAAVVKVIKAIDLQIQRIQNKTIWLQNAQKELENTMSKLKLKEISDWVEKQRKLYDDYFQELWQVKSALSTYHRVKEIIEMQVRLVNEYKAAFALFQGDKNFSPQEIDYMYAVYSGMLSESLKNLDQLSLVVNSFITQMGDAKRREIINTAYDHIQQNLTDLRQFNHQNKFLSMNRAANRAEIARLKNYYSIID